MMWVVTGATYMYECETSWRTVKESGLFQVGTCANSYIVFVSLLMCPQPATLDHKNIKHIWGPHGKPYGDPMLITYRDLLKVYTLNKYYFLIFIYYRQTMKKLVTHIN